jgi:hypothetical protein
VPTLKVKLLEDLDNSYQKVRRSATQAVNRPGVVALLTPDPPAVA